jgi:hypothetical protein
LTELELACRCDLNGVFANLSLLGSYGVIWDLGKPKNLLSKIPGEVTDEGQLLDKGSLVGLARVNGTVRSREIAFLAIFFTALSTVSFLLTALVYEALSLLRYSQSITP